MAGFGRSGRWFSFQHYDVAPDLVTFAKGVNSGYVPLGGVVITGPIAATFDDRAYPGGLTYSGHPLACAAAVATIEAMREEGMVENAARLGEEVFGPALAKIAEAHPSVGEVRGLGPSGPSSWSRTPRRASRWRRTAAPRRPMNATVAAAKAEGLLPFVNFNRIHVVPPLNIADDDAHRGLEILDRALAVADSHVAG